jgi:hypothetical protein
VNTAKIVEHGEQGDRAGVILKLLRKAIRQPPEAAILHSNSQVRSFDIAG